MVLDGGRLTELSGSSLFATRKAVVVTDLANLSPDVAPDLLEVVAARLPDVALVLVHGGGQKGKGVLDKLKALEVTVVDCPPVKTWELPQFVAAEVRQAGGTVEAGAAQALVDAVGNDLRALAAGAAQLVSDTEGHVEAEDVRRYFGGRADVTSFAVADAVLLGTDGGGDGTAALGAHDRGRPGAGHERAGLRRPGPRQARGRGAGAARRRPRPRGGRARRGSSSRCGPRPAAGTPAASPPRCKAVATADADVKGAAEDAAYSLERAVLAVAAARRT